MIITDIKIESFRNLSDICFAPNPHINVISGENGQGKTNIIEALWLFTGAKSFLGAKEAELIPFDNEFCRCSLSFKTKEREQTAFYQLGRKKHSILNSVKGTSTLQFAGSFAAVIFSPDNLFMIKGSSALRRRALDLVISQLKPRYIKLLNQYGKILIQRNALLKQISKKNYSESLLEEWDLCIAQTGALISKTRESYCEKLFPKAQAFYDGISNSRERITLKFISSAGENGKTQEAVLKTLKEIRKIDISCGFTTKGAHRDDFEILLNDKSLASFGSQGQQRSAVLSLKLAESDLIFEIMGEKPIILLDDVLSELDGGRQKYLLNNLTDRQIFLTCCDFGQIKDTSGIVRIENGKIFEKGEN